MSKTQNNKPLYALRDTGFPGYRGTVDYEDLEPEGMSMEYAHSTEPVHQLESGPLWSPADRIQRVQKGNVSPLQRLVLASFSVIMIGLFSMIVLTSMQRSTVMGLVGVGIMCSAICLVNVVFHWR